MMVPTIWILLNSSFWTGTRNLHANGDQTQCAVTVWTSLYYQIFILFWELEVRKFQAQKGGQLGHEFDFLSHVDLMQKRTKTEKL